MITPIRGRKLFYQKVIQNFASVIRNDNPDKGTETDILPDNAIEGYKIRNDNPDKGTETRNLWQYNHYICEMIRNDNPDKGTETETYDKKRMLEGLD